MQVTPLSLIAPGATVVLGGGDIRATVIGVALYGHGGARVMYLVSWFDAATRKEGWVEDCEVSAADDAERIAVGFRMELPSPPSPPSPDPLAKLSIGDAVAIHDHFRRLYGGVG